MHPVGVEYSVVWNVTAIVHAELFFGVEQRNSLSCREKSKKWRHQTRNQMSLTLESGAAIDLIVVICLEWLPST